MATLPRFRRPALAAAALALSAALALTGCTSTDTTAQDPVALLKKYGSRWELMHLKDLKKGVETGSHKGGTDVRNDVTLGTGQMDWPAILKAAKEAGVKHYFIEDESPSSVEQIPQTLEYLKSVKW